MRTTLHGSFLRAAALNTVLLNATFLAAALLSAAPALADEAGGGWVIDRGANAPNVEVSLAPAPGGEAATSEAGCPPAAAATQYTFPAATGVTIYVSPGYGPYFSPYGFGGIPGYGGYGVGGGYGLGVSPRVVVWATSPGGSPY